ncbi:MAG: calcium/sodium antiporter [Lewinellaceae bacterium]|nr:calcium/sodium antiporter [Saprospiraceae bacterium]MCB9339154.1 calcium/sodium antiporter [Lewinellaceae bacterium]
MISILLLLAGLALTLFSANWLVEGASSIAKRFHVSDLVIGLTIVALGTSTPELAINIFSALEGSSGLAIGNVLGSNIANILLILGVTAIISEIKVTTNTTWKEIPFSLLAAVTIGIMANDQWLDPSANGNFISRTDGMVLLCFLIIFMVYTFEIARFHPDPVEQVQVMPVWKSIVYAVVGICGLFFGGKLLVDGAVGLAQMIGMSERVIGLTIVAIGTSVPELATSIAAALKGKAGMAVGNVVGSNILNIFLILGTTAIIHPLPFQVPAMNHDLGLVVMASLLLFLATVIFTPKKISRREGVVFVALYVLYLGSLVFVK